MNYFKLSETAQDKGFSLHSLGDGRFILYHMGREVEEFSSYLAALDAAEEMSK